MRMLNVADLLTMKTATSPLRRTMTPTPMAGDRMITSLAKKPSPYR
jgi:hypothetical protein